MDVLFRRERKDRDERRKAERGRAWTCITCRCASMQHIIVHIYEHSYTRAIYRYLHAHISVYIYISTQPATPPPSNYFLFINPTDKENENADGGMKIQTITLKL